MYGLDLFSGIGGITKALEGYVEPVAYCELDAYARGVLFSRIADGSLPYAPCWDDVSTLSSKELPRHIDIVYGGFPCQDISIAGRREGLEGQRSGLFFEIMRLVDEVRPVFIFLENVPNIRTNGLAEAIRHISKRGFDCRWICLSAAEVGAPHKRNRWFLLAHANGFDRRLQPITGYELPEEMLIGVNGPKKSLAYTNGQGLGVSMPGGSPQDPRPRASEGQTTWWKAEPDVCRVVDELPRRVDRLRCLGNAVVPAQAREAFERLMGLKQP